ncbi:MAG: autorepressor SdpR family transcription factor [Clostridiales bacterium]|nr:autorepressor SdpR family transcription factor [Clostridiales bacterium]
MSETNIFKVLSDKQRRDILVMLRDGRLNAGEISQKLGVTPAALSYHLKLLKGANLIMEYKSGNFIYYEINTTVFDELILWVEQFGKTAGSKQHAPEERYETGKI